MESFSKQFEGKIAVVTGGTQGLGAATAQLFADRGAAGLVICGRNTGKGQAAAASLVRDRCPTFFVKADLADIADCRNVVAAAQSHFGRVDVLVNAAAATDRGTIFDTTPELFDRIFNVNVRAPFFLIQEAAKLMRSAKVHGTIVNVLSQAVHGGQPFISAYCAPKGALATLTKNVAFRVDAVSRQSQWTCNRMDEQRRRRSNNAALPWSQSWLANRGCQDAAVWETDRGR
jgi:NAD(P)-dependent dehydrogenase (short-subunit alcohol dehydrogenase family)